MFDGLIGEEIPARKVVLYRSHGAKCVGAMDRDGPAGSKGPNFAMLPHRGGHAIRTSIISFGLFFRGLFFGSMLELPIDDRLGQGHPNGNPIDVTAGGGT